MFEIFSVRIREFLTEFILKYFTSILCIKERSANMYILNRKEY